MFIPMPIFTAPAVAPKPAVAVPKPAVAVSVAPKPAVPVVAPKPAVPVVAAPVSDASNVPKNRKKADLPFPDVPLSPQDVLAMSAKEFHRLHKSIGAADMSMLVAYRCQYRRREQNRLQQQEVRSRARLLKSSRVRSDLEAAKVLVTLAVSK
jgi:hypothetical protein